MRPYVREVINEGLTIYSQRSAATNLCLKYLELNLP